MKKVSLVTCHLSLRQQSGRSMVEMLGVLAIMGILTAATFALYSMVMTSQKRSTVQERVSIIQQQIKSEFAQSDDFSGLTSAGVSAIIKDIEQNPYGGKYVANVNVSDPGQFYISITGLKKSDCEYFRDNGKTKWPDSVGVSAEPAGCDAEAGRNEVRVFFGR